MRARDRDRRSVSRLQPAPDMRHSRPMEPFPESAVLGWVLGLSIAALVIGCMIVGLIARLWPFITHSWSEKDQQARAKSAPGDGQGPQRANPRSKPPPGAMEKAVEGQELRRSAQAKWL